ncbi:hypothetical protein Si021_01062 [Streptococcus infantarius subsp. infantarius]|uniref:Membrane protein n=2 Tax=Streptococcus infantarius TaxID=102684 RepID=A0A380KPB8_9STRE|nr:hypothetical protein [Streptococcus infantarius]AEZ62962.1 hypothetical protein Sinf_1662 [Streptococcus infantarius subsp. infantarius CJ18]MCO4639989.1 hypothetical protein [Streptococcus infantarius subsp. infantarius]EDT47718.1 hypothetical protein STRINF_01083 [Streptococcus infantarius subsp. infantarius ATCC BAA-102]MCO4646159.1 hypothetical protein [Streptococcus infantarius subsp. infantarius]MCO4647279.1 hypothetical protein [Streptococcus infantarius subsp. infantarius]
MVSYEKIRQSLRSWTLFIAWVNVLAALSKVWSVISHYIVVNNLDKFKEQLDAEKFRILEASTNVGIVIIAVIALVINIIVAVLAFKNLLKIKDNAPSLSPYRIALIYTVVYNLASFALSVYLNIPLSPFNIVLPLVFLGLYAYVYNKAAQLLDKEDDETDSESVNQ